LTENERIVVDTKREATKLLEIETMPEVRKKPGQLEKRKIFNTNNPLIEISMRGLFV
jgi:hypothetical protein